MKISSIILAVSIMLIFTAGMLFEYIIKYKDLHKPKVEFHQPINPSERLIGYFDKDSVLHISIDNSIRFEWEGLEKDIPKDGESVLIEKTDENIIYLNKLK